MKKATYKPNVTILLHPSTDMLVVFTRPSHLQRINAPTDDTPRSLSALSAYLASHVVLPLKGRTTSSSPAQYNLVYPPMAQSPSGDTSVSISSFYHQDRVSGYCIFNWLFFHFYSSALSICVCYNEEKIFYFCFRRAIYFLNLLKLIKK